MKTELLYLTLVTVLTGLIWFPYVLDRMARWGLSDTVGYPTAPKPQSAWAERMMRAHRNGIENLVLFAALVLAAQAAGISNRLTAMACVLYFWARVVHPRLHLRASMGADAGLRGRLRRPGHPRLAVVDALTPCCSTPQGLAPLCAALVQTGREPRPRVETIRNTAWRSKAAESSAK